MDKNTFEELLMFDPDLNEKFENLKNTKTKNLLQYKETNNKSNNMKERPNNSTMLCGTRAGKGVSSPFFFNSFAN